MAREAASTGDRPDGARAIFMAFYNHNDETLSPDPLARLQQQKLAALLAHVCEHSRFYNARFGSMAPADTAADLASLPLTTRADIQDDQRVHPPYGSILTEPLDRYVRLHQTSGSMGTPLRWLDTAKTWEWWKYVWAIIFRAAGLDAGDRLLFPFSFGPFIGFWSAFESAVALGNLCLPAGGMTTTARLQFLLDNDVTLICCTPTYALRMAEVASEEGIDLVDSPVRGLIVAGEPGGSIPATRAAIECAWGARVFDHAGMTEVGPWGFECEEAPGGLHVMESEFIAEVIDPATGEVLPDGREGELVLTNLGRLAMPLIRYRTGDLARLTRGRCACGRNFARIEGGIAGRADDMLVIRGNNVFPSAIEGVVRDLPEIAEFRIRVETTGSMNDLRLEIEVASGVDGEDVAQRLSTELRNRLHFKARVDLAPTGSLPRFEMKSRRVVRADG